MPRVRQLLKHVSVQTAARKRKCYRKPDDHVITKGDVCLVVREGDGGSSNYCPGCAAAILGRVQDDLDQLRAELRI